MAEGTEFVVGNTDRGQAIKGFEGQDADLEPESVDNWETLKLFKMSSIIRIVYKGVFFKRLSL